MIRKIKTWFMKKYINTRFGRRHFKIRKNSLYGSFENKNTIYVDTDSVKW